MNDYEQFKTILADGIARAQMLEAAGLALTDEQAAELLGNEARCLMFYNQVLGALHQKVAIQQQRQVQATVGRIQANTAWTFVLVFGVVLFGGWLFWRSLGL